MIDCTTGDITELPFTEEDREDWQARQPDLEAEKVRVIGLAEQTFFNLASHITQEPTITATKLISWQEKFALAQKWHDNHRPDPHLMPVTYDKALTEARNRTDELSDPVVLLEYWLENGDRWNILKDRYYLEVEPKIRAEIRAAADLKALARTEASLQSVIWQSIIA